LATQEEQASRQHMSACFPHFIVKDHPSKHGSDFAIIIILYRLSSAATVFFEAFFYLLRPLFQTKTNWVRKNEKSET
jgi:hypothetical protein